MAVKINPHVSVDCVIFGFNEMSLKVLLIDRNQGLPPVKQTAPKSLKLPGRLVYDDEDVDTAAVRVLKELTGLENIYLQQFNVFGSPDRLNKKEDLEWLQSLTKMKINRVVTIAYYSLIKLNQSMPCDGKVIWANVMNIPKLAFDHNEIIKRGLLNLRREMKNEPIAFELLPKKFTIRQLQSVYENILDKRLDNRNFRKGIAKWDYLVQVNEKEKNVAHKPAQYFRFDKRKYVKQQIDYLSDK
jgi:8-oxo-dGTP diphosphatase